jgi:hypothetical protein
MAVEGMLAVEDAAPSIAPISPWDSQSSTSLLPACPPKYTMRSTDARPCIAAALALPNTLPALTNSSSTSGADEFAPLIRTT